MRILIDPCGSGLAVSYDKAGLSQPHQLLEEVGSVHCTVEGMMSFVKQSLLMTAIPSKKLGKGPITHLP